MIGIAALVLCLAGCPEQPALSLNGLDNADAVNHDALPGTWRVEEETEKTTGAEDANESAAPAESAEPADDESQRPMRERPVRETFVDIEAVDGETGRYSVTIRRGRHSDKLDARLVELAGSRILDCRPIDTRAKEAIQPHYHAPHAFFKLEPVADGFTLAFLTQAWLDEQRNDGNLKTPHTLINDIPVLTGDAGEIQHFIVEYANAGPAANKGWAKMGGRLVRVDDR